MEIQLEYQRVYSIIIEHIEIQFYYCFNIT